MIYYVKYSKRLSYLVGIINELANTVNKDEPRLRLIRSSIDKVGGRFKLIAETNVAFIPQHERIVVGNAGGQPFTYQVYELKDWSILGSPFFDIPDWVGNYVSWNNIHGTPA